MIIDERKPLSPRQVEIFWNEIKAIQRRWQPFFPEEQKQAISITVSEKESVLHFSDAYNLPDEVSGEIRFIYTLVAVDDDVYDEYQLLRREGSGAQATRPNNKHTERRPKEDRKNRYRSVPPPSGGAGRSAPPQ